VLLNLLSNSVNHTQRNGKILIKVIYFNKKYDDNDYLLVSVSDNGEGIQKEKRKNLFKLFG
jgi:signal transduction histidine kinase